MIKSRQVVEKVLEVAPQVSLQWNRLVSISRRLAPIRPNSIRNRANIS